MAERPLECSHCKRPVKIVYKEIVKQSIVTTEMCSECPIFQEKLHGHAHATSPESWGESLCCGSCRTTLESVKTGNPLGCAECYAIFSDIIQSELIAANGIAPRMQKTATLKKNISLHTGNSPGRPVHTEPSSKITALNEALNDALKKENYEQAAWLRDQIKLLTEHPNDKKL